MGSRQSFDNPSSTNASTNRVDKALGSSENSSAEPNPSNRQFSDNSRYVFAGDPLGDVLVPSVCKQLLGVEPCLDDLRFVDTTTYHLLLELKEHHLVEFSDFDASKSLIAVKTSSSHGLDAKDRVGQYQHLIGSLSHWLADSLAHWLTASLPHWLTDSLTH